MNINLESLFYMVYEHFGNIREYHKIRHECWEKLNGDMRKYGYTPNNYSLYVDRLKDRDAYNFARASERMDGIERTLSEFCNILGIDHQRLYHMVKTIIKWHDKRDWQICFPFDEKNTRAILSYLQK